MQSNAAMLSVIVADVIPFRNLWQSSNQRMELFIRGSKPEKREMLNKQVKLKKANGLVSLRFAHAIIRARAPFWQQEMPFAKATKATTTEKQQTKQLAVQLHKTLCDFSELYGTVQFFAAAQTAFLRLSCSQ